MIVTALFVDETLVKTPLGSSSELGAIKPPPLSTWEPLRSRCVTMVLSVYSYVMLLTFAFTTIIPALWFTPVELGGYGPSPLHISIFMDINGLGQAIWAFLVFPPLRCRIGTAEVLRACAIARRFVYAMCSHSSTCCGAPATSVPRQPSGLPCRCRYFSAAGSASPSRFSN